MDVVRLAQEAAGDRRVYQSLLQDKSLPPESVRELGVFLVHSGAFRMSQFGLSDVAESGRMPDDFVPAMFAEANDATRAELCAFAEIQLRARGDEALHRFLLGVALGPWTAVVKNEAWASLYRWYDRQKPGDRGPFKIAKEPVARFFGTPAALLERFIGVLGDEEALDKPLYFEFVQSLLRYPDPDILPALVAEPLTLELRERLLETMRNPSIRLTVRGACANFLGYLAGHEEWLVEIGRLLSGFRGTDLEGACTGVLDQICRAHEDLGEGTRETFPIPNASDFDWQAMLEQYARELRGEE